MEFKTRKKTIIAIGDTHFPFASEAVLDWIIDDVIPSVEKDLFAVVQMGDLYDLFSFSRFPKRMVMTPRTEMWHAMDQAEEMWKRIRANAPRAKCFQLKGNHDARLAKRVVETMPELDHLLHYHEIFSFPGVTTIHDDKTTLQINDWHFMHGHTKEGKHIESVHFNNVCVGHTHRGGQWVQRLQQRKDPMILTELNAGFVADPFHEALIYRPLVKYFKWTWGVAMIDEHGGRFIPYRGKLK